MKAKKGDIKIDEPVIRSLNLFPVVGIGASAGGLDAFKKLLKAIPENSGMAYVLVQHLDPNHESLLPEILQKVTPIPVLEITNDIKVLPDHIYVIPSNKIMVATDGVLVLAPRPAKSKTQRNLPIDLFFASLAEVHQDHAIGVVLSGTASDGTQGLKAIKEHGGITFAQDEASAEYEGMPHSAAQAGVVDFILPPEEIPNKLLEVTSKTVLSDEALQNIPKEEEDVFKQILSLLRIRKGVDFTYYKQTTIRRRILRRMVVNKNEEPSDYLKFLRGSTAEQDLLYQDMLIPVTSFFRDKKVFENLCSHVFPAIIKNKVPGEITRVWVAGCSTGQEVYSFAMCFKEFLGDNHERIQIFGTDLSEPAILKARTGLYEKTELDSISPERLRDYFTKSNGGFQVNKSIRDICVFAHHNFLKDPPFGKMDCISCRNVLIYMEPYLQKKALTTFHYALNPKGYLLLGKSETTGGVPELFAAEGKSDKLYTRKDAPGRFIQVTSQRNEQILSRAVGNTKSETIRNDFQKTADDILLTKYTPAGVVVNEAMDIVHFRGNTANFLEQAPGKPSHNLLMMAKHGLGFELRNILHKAKTDKTIVVKENIPLQVSGSIRNISIEAMPLPNTLEPYYLVLFHDYNVTDAAGLVKGSKRKVSPTSKKDDRDVRIQLLEQQLSQLREDMRSITEDQEASNEELQSANEELLSGSEELQSLNEELETSKEELQSTNEELTVLNHELVGLNEQVTDARNYSESIVATLYQPLLVLDKHLRVKTANKAFYKTFNVNEQETEGVLVYDLGNRQWNIPELRTLLEEILPEKKQITDFEVTHNFTSIGNRIILLNALEITRERKEEKLILLSIEDITEKAFALKKIEESEKRYNMMLMISPFGFAVFKGKNMVITLANDTIKEIWGKGNDVEGKPLFDVLPELRDSTYPGLLGDVYTTGVHFQGNEILASFLSDGKIEDKYFNLVYQPYLEADETISGVTVIAHEVTGQVILKKALEAQQAAELKASKLVEETSKRYYTMLMESPFAFCIMKGKDMTVSLANDLIKEFWGKGNMVEGKTILQVLPELKNQPFPAMLDKVYTTGISVYANEMLTRLQHKDKMEERYFNIVYQPDHDADGIISGVITIAYDVTEMVLARKKIEESEDQFQAAVAAVEGIVWTNNSKGEMEGDQLGWSSLTGQNYEAYQKYGWADAIHPDDVQNTLEAWHEAVRNRKNFVFEHRVKYKNGNWGHFSVKAIPLLNADGTIREWVGVHTDISERKLSEDKLKESEQRFRGLVEKSPYPISIFKGKELKIEVANEPMLKIFNVGQEAIGKSFLEILPEMKEQPFMALMLDVLENGGTHYGSEQPAYFIRKNGEKEIYYFNFVYQPYYENDGSVSGIMALATDVTEQVLARKKVEASEHRYHEMIYSSPSMIAIFKGEEMIIEIANDAIIQSWGKGKDIVGKSLLSIMPEIIEQGFDKILSDVYKTGIPFHAYEAPVSLVHNGKIEVLHYTFVYQAQRNIYGAIEGVAVIANEVTPRALLNIKVKESEEQFSTLAENMENLAWLADGEGSIYWYNKRWFDFTGTTLEEMKGWGWQKVHHPDHVDRVVDFVKEAWHKNEAFELTFPLRSADGEYKWFLTRAYPIADELGKVVRWIGTNTDIHEQKEQKERLQDAVEERTVELSEANEELKNMNKELEAFTYVSSHDLQEPLRKIRIMADTILEKENQNLSDKGKNYFRLMQNAAERMQTLIQDLLAFSRLSTADRKFETTNLNIIIEEVKKEFKEAIAEKNATVEVKEICEAKIIPFQFRQLMHNLIGNALKFSNPNIPPHIIIESKNMPFSNLNIANLPPKKEYCHITVSDNGIGFEKEFTEKIFEVFQKLHSKEEYAGTGIGLAIVKKIVDNHNGIITASGELNKGATFDIYLPA